ncbi:MAG: hypothetical protein QGF90_11270 [Gammaproteobacteria bacterium]|nr:hypothetical protein [Gammaproteobacteria bacterium]
MVSLTKSITTLAFSNTTLVHSNTTLAHSNTTEGCSRFRYQDALSQVSVELSRKYHGSSGLGSIIRQIGSGTQRDGSGVIGKHDSHFHCAPPIDSFCQTPVERSLH